MSKHSTHRGQRALPHHLAPSTLAVAMALALAACGGGGSDNASTGPDNQGNGTPTGLTLSGTVAGATAIASAPVALKCMGGNGTATTGTDGSYNVTLAAGAALPCVLAATTPSGTLYSAAAGSGSSATAHITPATDLVVAQLSGTVPDTYYASYDGSSTAAAALSASAISAASTAVVSTLKAGGVDFSNSGDLISGALAAGSSGNAYGQALAALATALTSSGTSQAALETAVALGSGNAAVATLSNTASLPADLLLKAKALTCASLRSGTYRRVDFSSNRNESVVPTGTVTIDAANLRATDSSATYTLTANGSCRFLSSGGSDIAVTAAGVLVMRNLGDDYSSSNHYLSIAFPEQSHTVAELAGEWNSMTYDRDTNGAALTLRTNTLTLDANGKAPSVLSCASLTGSCSAPPDANRASLALSVNSSGGGFNWSGTDSSDGSTWTDRAFAYRAGGGELMLVTINGSGGISLRTRKVARGLPTVGTVSDSLSVTTSPIANGPWLLSATNATVSASRSTIVSVDTAQMQWVRNNVTNFTTGVTIPETIIANSPRDGYAHRPAATNVTRSDGSIGSVSEWVSLSMRGMGMGPVGFPSNNNLILSATLGE